LVGFRAVGAARISVSMGMVAVVVMTMINVICRGLFLLVPMVMA